VPLARVREMRPVARPPRRCIQSQETHLNYRIYVLDQRFQIMEGYDFEGRDDVSALEKGIALGVRNPVEVWQRDRLIACIGLDGDAAPGPHFDSRARERAHAA
jgi:hypothetical protein